MLAEGKLGAKMTYSTAKADIYGGTYFIHDFFQDQDITEPGISAGRDSLLGLIGAAYYMSDADTLSVEASNYFFRKDSTQTTLQAIFRHVF